jgi:HEAT repeat protein
LIEDLSTKAPASVRVAAARRLGEIKERRAVAPLILALREPIEPLQVSAAEALGAIREPDAVMPLCDVFDSAGPRARGAAARALAVLQDSRAVEPLRAAMRTTGQEAASALAALGDTGIRSLIEELGSVDTRRFVTEALVGVGPSAVTPLIQALGKDHSKYARLAAVRVLAEIADPRSATALEDALKVNDPEFAAAAYRFLIRRGRPGTETLLVQALNLYGNLEMAGEFSRSGNLALKSAAASWAAKYGYLLESALNSGETVLWGKPSPTVSELAMFHFDDSLASSAGLPPARAAGTSFVPGRWNSALSIAPGGILSYPIAHHLDFKNGTIEMWISPRYEGTHPVYSQYNHALVLYAAGNGDQFLVSENAERRFYAGSVIGRRFSGASGGDMAAWKPGNWHHIVFTYSFARGRQRLYIDGALVSENDSRMPVPDSSAATFTVDGDPYGHSSAFLIDELRILDMEEGPAVILQSATLTRPPADGVAIRR